jgi:uncharacterized damage-inducible protein DinB
MDDTGTLFLSKSRHYLTESYLPKLERALAGVSDEDVWWRPNEASNTIGNLLLHLTGSIRYWIASVAGGAESERVRQEEFDAFGGTSRPELVARLRDAVLEADAVLARLTAADLLASRIAYDDPTTVLDAIYHGVEHFAMHTGQILQLVKLRSGVDLRLTD